MKKLEAIHIAKPSEELVSFIEKAQIKKRMRMKSICEKYRRLVKS